MHSGFKKCVLKRFHLCPCYSCPKSGKGGNANVKDVLEKIIQLQLSNLCSQHLTTNISTYESFSDVGEIRVWWRANFQSGYRVLKKVF